MARAGSLRPPIRRRFNTPVVWTVAWFVVGLGVNLAQTFLYQQLWVMQLAVIGFHFAWGVGQATLFTLMLLDRRKIARILLPVMLLGLALLFVGAGALTRWGDQAAFAIQRGAYDRVVADAAARKLPRPSQGQSATIGKRDGASFAYDSERPGLIAFSWAVGLPSGGASIVYDDKDLVPQAAFDGPDVGIKAALNGLVNGHIAECRMFAEPHYYFCTFG